MTEAPIVEKILAKLASLAVPMDEREFTNEEYNKVFSRGAVITPIGEVKIGQNQFSKLAEKDGGSRRGLIGAMRQTLADPVVVIREREEARLADVFIKSFTAGEGMKENLIVSVVVDINGAKIAISTYKRKRREVIGKIKKADGIVYIKDNGGSPTNGE
ncbi:MAG: hypothetical protein LBU85_08790 [Treponema sp.]|jgi:hypothetical protein|nr:hypothetical protein [Treponema sp.]